MSVAVGATWAPAQQVPAPFDFTPHRADEFAELDALASALLLEQGTSTLEPDDFIELSRLLAVPCDQLLWLGRRIAALENQPDAARALAERAQQRAAALGHLTGDCAEYWPRWLAVPEPKPPLRLSEVLEPAELKERLELARRDPKLLADLSEFEKFALLARGVSGDLLIDLRSRPPWDMPREVLRRLTQSGTLPRFADLRQLEQLLHDSFATWEKQGGSGWESEKAESVTITFQVAAALLDRALGLDSEDVTAARTERPIPYLATPIAWRQTAESLEAAGLKSWAALAYVLAAGPSTGEAPDADATAAARRLWAHVRAVNDTLWPQLDSAPDGWLVRLDSPQRLIVPGAMPLAAAFRANDRQARRRHEEDILSLIRDVSDLRDEVTADRLLQLIQRAKAAELGPSAANFNPLDLGALKKMLGCEEDNWIYLFVEILRLQEVGPETPDAPFCGIALYQTEYKERTRATDVYACRVKIVRWKTSPRGVVEEALRDGPPPLRGLNVRVLVAPDGPLPADWFPFEHGTLLAATEWPISADPGWVLYTPSAGALAAGPWTLDPTLRTWHRSGFRHETVPPALRAADLPIIGGSGVLIQNLGRHMMSMHRLDLADVRVPVANLKELLEQKRRTELRVIPLWVSQTRP